MLRKLIPRFVKRGVTRQLLRLVTSPLLFYIVPFLPSHRSQTAYMLAPSAGSDPTCDSSGLPVPPKSLWAAYGTTVEEYLASGQHDVETLTLILAQAAQPLAPGERILDFGCAAGRMMRWLAPFAASGEVWGADVSADHVLWCEQHLNPPFDFIVATTAPHLPFEDNYFDLIYVGSVFTHIDDLAKSWLMELRRVLRPGGRLYVTLHDHHTLHILQDQLPAHWLTRLLNAEPAFQSFIKTGFRMFTVGRALDAQVFYDIDYFCQRLCVGYDVLSVTPEAYGYQTAVLLQKRASKTQEHTAQVR